MTKYPLFQSPLFSTPPVPWFPLLGVMTCWVGLLCGSLILAAQENAAVGERAILLQVKIQREMQSEMLQKLRRAPNDEE